MALLWQKRADGARYEVRQAGKTRRLYTNGVLHTQYNPARLLTGSVWDLLTLGALFLPRERLRRVLVLGVGGGAVIRQLLALVPEIEITGVELNPVHLSVARRYFGLRDPRVTLHAENAITWLALHDGAPFDLVIDDLFGERDGVPCRAVRADADWFHLAATHLASRGVLVVNYADAREARAAGWPSDPGLRRRFHAAVSMTTPGCHNRVVAYLPFAAGPAELRVAIAAEPRLRGPWLRYGARALRPRAMRK